jgi:toxin ParE1/3/4
MTRRVVRSPESEQDLAEIADYLARNSARAALRFLEAAEATITRLTDMPGLGSVFESDHSRLANLQVSLVKGFPAYLIFYRYTDDEVQIVRVVHGARDLENL